MKVLVLSMGEALDSKVDPRFGRASFFVVVDTASNQFEVVRNDEGRGAAQGAGIKAAESPSASARRSSSPATAARTPSVRSGRRGSPWCRPPRGTWRGRRCVQVGRSPEALRVADVRGHWA